MMAAKAGNIITIFEKQGDKHEEMYRYALFALGSCIDRSDWRTGAITAYYNHSN
jgi:hypothetical protein